MHFLVIGEDGPGATGRRDAARPAHMAKMTELREAGHVVIGAALTGDDNAIVGSVLVVDFPSRAEVDAWLAVEPLQLEGVWERITVRPCRVGDAYLEALRA